MWRVVCKKRVNQQCFLRFKSSWIWLCIIGQSKKNLLLLLILWNVSGHSMSTLWDEYISVNKECAPFWACAIGCDALSEVQSDTFISENNKCWQSILPFYVASTVVLSIQCSLCRLHWTSQAIYDWLHLVGASFVSDIANQFFCCIKIGIHTLGKNYCRELLLNCTREH
jgi:hypothetical protein